MREVIYKAQTDTHDRIYVCVCIRVCTSVYLFIYLCVLCLYVTYFVCVCVHIRSTHTRCMPHTHYFIKLSMHICLTIHTVEFFLSHLFTQGDLRYVEGNKGMCTVMISLFLHSSSSDTYSMPIFLRNMSIMTQLFLV